MTNVLDKAADSAPTDDDVLYLINDPTGTPGDRRTTVAQLAASAPFSSRYANSEFDIVRYGDADPSGATDSSEGIAATVAAAFATRIVDPAGTNVRAPRALVTIPPGTFLVNDAEALMTELGGGQRMNGLDIRGAGRRASQIIFDPTDPTAALMRNADQFLGWTISNLGFVSLAGIDDASKPTLLLSESAGGPKDFIFDRIELTGHWDTGIRLSGSTTNAQFGLNDCTARSVSFVNGVIRSIDGDSDQAFVNYWINNFRGYLDGGYFVKAEGFLGHLHVLNSLIAFGEVDRPGTLFHLGEPTQDLNSSHLSIRGLYSELHYDLQRIMESHWSKGSITMEASWDGGGTGDFDDLTSTAIDIYADLDGTCRYRFDNVGSKGKHRYHYGDASAAGASDVRYDGGDFKTAVTPDDVFEYVPEGGTNQHANRPAIHLVGGCQFGGADEVTDHPDQTYGWAQARGVAPEIHRVTLESVRGDLARAGDAAPTRILPSGAILGPAQLRILSGGVATTTWQFDITTTEVIPTVLYSFPSGAVALADGLVMNVAAPTPAGYIANDNSAHIIDTTGIPTGGTFSLLVDVDGVVEETGTIAFDASAATIDAAIEALAEVPAGTVTSAGGALPTAVTVSFTGALAGTRVVVTAGDNNLTGGTAPTVTSVATALKRTLTVDSSIWTPGTTGVEALLCVEYLA